jgi:hypothetical protein
MIIFPILTGHRIHNPDEKLFFGKTSSLASFLFKWSLALLSALFPLYFCVAMPLMRFNALPSALAPFLQDHAFWASFSIFACSFLAFEALLGLSFSARASSQSQQSTAVHAVPKRSLAVHAAPKPSLAEKICHKFFLAFFMGLGASFVCWIAQAVMAWMGAKTFLGLSIYSAIACWAPPTSAYFLCVLPVPLLCLPVL